jgi:hypothetical protein
MPRVQPSCRGSGRCAYCRDSPHPTAPRFKISPSPPPEAEAGDTPHQKETEGGSGEARADPAEAMLRAASTKPQRRPRLRQRRGAGFLFFFVVVVVFPVIFPPRGGTELVGGIRVRFRGCIAEWMLRGFPSRGCAATAAAPELEAPAVASMEETSVSSVFSCFPSPHRCYFFPFSRLWLVKFWPGILASTSFFCYQ